MNTMQGKLTNRRTARRGNRGFSLLEVMVATSILAVGTVSVLAIFASAVGFANRRQSQAELAQVLEEARSEARVLVDAFRPPSSIGNAAKSNKGKVTATKLPGSDTGKVEEKGSKVFAGYRYGVQFTELVRGVPEAGFQTTITVLWGENQTYTETLAVLPSSIPEQEFQYSQSFDEEQRGKAAGKGREVR